MTNKSQFPKILEKIRKIGCIEELFKDLPSLIKNLNELYHESLLAEPGHTPFVLIEENQRVNPQTGKIEYVHLKDVSIAKYIVEEELLQKGKEDLENLKTKLLEAENGEDLVSWIPWTADHMNRLYFYQARPNFIYPPRLLYFEEGSSLSVREGRIWNKSFYYEHFGIYESPEGERVLFRDLSGWFEKNMSHEPELSVLHLGFKYLESISFEYEMLKPILALEHPKNLTEVRNESLAFSLEHIKTLLRIVYHSPSSTKEIPEKLLVSQCIHYFRRNPSEQKWRFPRNHNVRAKQEHLEDQGESEAHIKIDYRFWFKTLGYLSLAPGQPGFTNP